MNKTVLDYEDTALSQSKGILLGRISLSAAVVMQIGIFQPLLAAPFILLLVILAPFSVIRSKGKSISDWIALAILSFYFCGISWMILMGR